MSKFYAVRNGLNGVNTVVTSWPECQKLVKGVSGVTFKSFKNKEDAILFSEGKTEKPNTTGLLKVYTDGSTPDNGEYGAIGGFGVFFGKNDPRNQSVKVTREKYNLGPKEKVTNNLCEILGITYAYIALEKEIIRDKSFKAIISTDSELIHNSITKWYKGWVEKGEVQKKKNWRFLEPLYNYYVKYSDNIQFIWEMSFHKALNPGNQQADILASKAHKDPEVETSKKRPIETVDTESTKKLKTECTTSQ